MAHPSRSDVESIPFVATDPPVAYPAYGYGVVRTRTSKHLGHTHTGTVGDEQRAASVAEWNAPLAYAFGDNAFVVSPPDCLDTQYVSTTPSSDMTSAVAQFPALDTAGIISIGADSVQPVVVPTAQRKKAPAKKTRVKSTKKTRVGSLTASAMEDALVDESSQATRKSEIERKSRLKRATNMDTMKLQVTQLEQSLLRLAQQYHEPHDPDTFRQYTHSQLPVEMRLVKLRELLAHQFQQSVQLRSEQFQLFQRLQHFVDINDSLRNVVSAHTFADSTVYDLLSWWTPPTDEQCHQLAADSMAKIHAFTFSKRKATDEHAGWKLTYDHSMDEGCKFMVTRSISMMDVPSVAQTIWDARATREGANMLAGGICQVDISVLTAVNKDMLVINRSMRFPDFTVHTLYLMFRVVIDDVFYIVSRELGRSQNMTWDNSTHDFPESSADKWVDVFTWSTFTKVPHDPRAVVCTGKCAQPNTAPKQTYRMDYGGWWGTTYAWGIRRWLMEMLFMVVRWEALHIQPQGSTGSRLPQSEPNENT